MKNLLLIGVISRIKRYYGGAEQGYDAMSDGQLTFEKGEANFATLAKMTREIFAEPAAAAELQAAGLDPKLFESDIAFSFKPGQSGVTGVETVLILVTSHVVVPVGKKVLLDLWKKLALPKILERFGDDAIGEERAAAAAKGKAKSKPKAKAASALSPTAAEPSKARQPRAPRKPKAAQASAPARRRAARTPKGE